MSEHDIQSQIIDYLRAEGFLVIRINSGRKANIPFCYWYEPEAALPEAGTAVSVNAYRQFTDSQNRNTRGVSDLLAFKPGMVLAPEIKRPGGKLRDDQKRFLQAARQAGVTTIIADSLDDFKFQLRSLRGATFVI